jgi:hypothetical protein
MLIVHGILPFQNELILFNGEFILQL